MATFKEIVRSITSFNLASSGQTSQDAVDAIVIQPTANTAAADVVTVTNAAHGQATTYTLPDCGAASNAFVTAADATAAATFNGITAGTAAASKAVVLDSSKNIATIASATVNDVVSGATPVHQVDPGSCTITAAAGASNTATVTVQLKDGAGNNITRVVPFTVYCSSAADGLTLASAASTGWSVASGGLSVNNGAAITTSICCVSSASGGCVLSLLDTGKQTSYLVLVLSTGVKISAQLSSGSYGA